MTTEPTAGEPSEAVAAEVADARAPDAEAPAAEAPRAEVAEPAAAEAPEPASGPDPEPASGPDPEPASASEPTRWQRIRHRVVTPPAIYGTMLVSAIIGSSDDGDTDLDILIVTVPTLVVFWGAHVFAEAIAHYGKHGRDRITMRQALRFSVGHSSGLLYAGIIPCAFLVLGATDLMNPALAYGLALFTPVLLLGALGWFALADRGARWPGKLFAAWVTSSLGLIVIILKIAFH